MNLYSLNQNELKDICKNQIETFESWLKRLISEEMIKKYWADYFLTNDDKGDKVIKNEISKQVLDKFNEDNDKYNNNPINATTFDNLIDIISNPKHYVIFKPYFWIYPFWVDVTKYFLGKLLDIRNMVYHSNPISVRDAEKLICYTNDIIDSFKKYYQEKNMWKEYNVPEFIKFNDSFWNEKFLISENKWNLNTHNFYYYQDSKFYLRPWDKFSIEVFVDATFEEWKDYKIEWSICRKIYQWKKISIEITEDMVSEKKLFTCKLIQNKNWHKYWNYDDEINFMYKILPPL